MDPVLLERPHLSSVLQFPAPVTGVFRHDSDIIVVMKDFLWYYSPFTMRRQIHGLIHQRYRHPVPIKCVCGLTLPRLVLKQMVQTGSSDELNLLLYDSASSLCLLNLDLGFLAHRFLCSFLEQGDTIRDIRSSLSRPTEFVALSRSSIFVCRIDDNELVACHVHPLCASSVAEFGGGYLALFNRRLFYLDGPALKEFRPGLSADHFAVDSANSLIVCRTAKDVAEFEFVGRNKFSVGRMAAYDIGDGFFVALLKSKVIVIMKCDDHQKMAVNVPFYAIEHALDRCFRLVCRVSKQRQTLGIHMFVGDIAVMVEVPLELFPTAEDDDEEEGAEIDIETEPDIDFTTDNLGFDDEEEAGEEQEPSDRSDVESE
jgi:hypothetical protein